MTYASARLRQLLDYGYSVPGALKIATDETAAISGMISIGAAGEAPKPLVIQRVGVLESVQMPDGKFVWVELLRTRSIQGDPVAKDLYARYLVVKAGGVDPAFAATPTPGAPPVLAPLVLPTGIFDQLPWPVEKGAV